MDLPEGDEPEGVLGAAGDVLPLLAAQLLGRVHRLLLAGVQEAGAVRQQYAAGQRLEHSPGGGRQARLALDGG